MKLNSASSLGLLSVLSAITSVQSAYTLKDDYTGHNFFPGFDFFTDADPTKGFVAYQSLRESVKSQLAGFIVADTPRARSRRSAHPHHLLDTRHTPGKKAKCGSNSTTTPTDSPHVFLGVDYRTMINSTTAGKGRASTRVTSQKSYNPGTLLVADIAHMPTGCGSWPALWMVGPQWPNDGEIDIVENVNNARSNSVTLHTSAGCAVQNKTSQDAYIGTLETANCDVKAQNQPNNAGCSISMPERSEIKGSASTKGVSGASFGPDFNAQGGGVYAMQWTTKAINVWFFPYSNSTSNATSAFPSDLLSAKPNPSTKTWGTPAASFAGSGCDYQARFQNLSIVVNTALCGDWAGNVWESGGCAASTGVSTCEEYVAKNPEAFTQSFWEIRSLKVFGEN